MPVRMMTDEEKEKIFGSGFIVIGQQMPVPGKQDSAPSGTPPKAGVSVRYANKEDYKKLNFYNVGPVYRAKESSALDLNDATRNVSRDEPAPPKDRV
jgi:hypothetical protein